MNQTAHSEVAKLHTVYLKSARSAFKNQNFIDQHWQDLNYLTAPNFEMALNEYDYFVKLLATSGVEIKKFRVILQ